MPMNAHAYTAARGRECMNTKEPVMSLHKTRELQIMSHMDAVSTLSLASSFSLHLCNAG